MLSGKYWITPGLVVDVTTSEHALYAKNHLLGLLGTGLELKLDKRLFSPLTPAELLRYGALGVAENVLAELRSGTDPRLIVIRDHGWVRTRGSALYLWKASARTMRMIRNAEDFWSKQPQAEPSDPVDVILLSVETTRVVRVRDLRT